jgi:hypothetical protein
MSTGKERSLLIVSLLIFLASFSNLNTHSFRGLRNVELKAPSPHSSSNRTNPIYGHLHIAKTAGSSINGNLSMHFERVCGNKGYSYDAFQTNERAKIQGPSQLMKRNAAVRVDSYSKIYRNKSRGRVPPELMDEIGYEDCDWVSMERSWEDWQTLFQDWSIPLELHVPCREPIDHIMSQCNHRLIKFDCNLSHKAMIRQINDCLGGYVKRRYNRKLETAFTVKCFDFKKTDEYMKWVGEHLQRKRITANYNFRQTNAPRHKDSECVWTRNDVRQVIEEYLLETVDYYAFCDKCIGSEKDLLPLSYQKIFH